MGSGFVIDYAWISKLLRDAAFTWRARKLSCWLKEWLISGNLAIWTVHVLEKVLFLKCFWVLEEINSRFCSKTQWQMFLLVSGCHVGAHMDGHQHGVSIQISINLGKKFLRISWERKIALTRICISTFFHFPDSGLYLLNGFDFYFDLFWIAWHWKPTIYYLR